MKKILEKKIGIIGCGTMGLPMLKVLKKKNVDVTGHDIKNKSNFKKIKNCFIENKFSFFRQNEIIISAVRDIKQTLEICEGKNGLFQFKYTHNFFNFISIVFKKTKIKSPKKYILN
jgi:3-hydroxyisobutyrate dehydrogenase-like beta-hydroxyacid dehydrogenase